MAVCCCKRAVKL